MDRDDWARLSAAEQAALRLCDAVVWQPSAVDEDLRRDLRRSYSNEQVVELTLDVVKWSHQKLAVALGTDREVVPGQLTDLAFDESGEPLR